MIDATIFRDGERIEVTGVNVDTIIRRCFSRKAIRATDTTFGYDDLYVRYLVVVPDRNNYRSGANAFHILGKIDVKKVDVQ